MANVEIIVLLNSNMIEASEGKHSVSCVLIGALMILAFLATLRGAMFG